tara:strand:- start:77 stop:550 length:474 start_codon:yes stop_codon:yes gene_type:complete
MRFTILLFLIVLLSCQKTKVNHLQVPIEIEKLVFDYVEAWSKRDVDYITDNIYGEPFVLFLEDTTIFLNDFKNIKAFLNSTFSNLESSNYSHSTFNKWETFKLRGDTAILEMNFTRFKKNGEILGKRERTATYVLKKSKNDKAFKIFSIIAHTVIDS